MRPIHKVRQLENCKISIVDKDPFRYFLQIDVVDGVRSGQIRLTKREARVLYKMIKERLND